MKFKGLPVEPDDRAHVPSCSWTLLGLQFFYERLCRLLKRLGIKMDFGISPVMPASMMPLFIAFGHENRLTGLFFVGATRLDLKSRLQVAVRDSPPRNLLARPPGKVSDRQL